MSTQVKPTARRLGAAAAAIALAACLAACGANVTARTGEAYNPAQGTEADSGELSVRSAVVISETDGVGSLGMVLVNNADKANSLTDVAVADGGRGVITGGTVAIPAHSTVKVGLTEALSVATGDVTNPASVVVTGEKIVAGGATTVTLTFASSPSVTLPVLVVPRDGEFKNVVMPTPTATAATS